MHFDRQIEREQSSQLTGEDAHHYGNVFNHNKNKARKRAKTLTISTKKQTKINEIKQAIEKTKKENNDLIWRSNKKNKRSTSHFFSFSFFFFDLAIISDPFLLLDATGQLIPTRQGN